MQEPGFICPHKWHSREIQKQDSFKNPSLLKNKKMKKQYERLTQAQRKRRAKQAEALIAMQTQASQDRKELAKLRKQKSDLKKGITLEVTSRLPDLPA